MNKKLCDKKDDFDILLGERLRTRRIMLGVSQKELGDAVDITVKEIVRYENGDTVLPSSILYLFSKCLKVPINYFIENTHITSHESKKNLYASGLLSEDREKYILDNINIMDKNSKHDIIHVVENIKKNLEKKTLTNDIKFLINVLKDIKTPELRNKIILMVDELSNSLYITN